MEQPKELTILQRQCDKCNVVKHARFFYKGHDTCRDCVVKAAKINVTPLEDKVEAYRQEKFVKEQLRAELKKIAIKRIEKKKKAKRAKAIKKIIPQIEDDTPAVEPITQELAKRELARRKLIEFVKQMHPRYKDGWVHHDICNRLEKFSKDVAAGLSPRLMLLMPPRHGKSQLASKLYPAWHLGHYPHHEFIGASYNISLALDFSRELRDVIKSDQYAKIFPNTKLNPDFMSAEAWRLRSDTGVGAGGYNAAGVGGGITGKGAHILTIDDPIKSHEEADSPDIRKKLWNWYQTSAYTRLAPGGGVLVIQTCWHDDDLAGRLQKEMAEDPDADQFEVIKYPAIAEEDEEFRLKGDALHIERYDLKALLSIKKVLGPNHWSALYQQTPISEEGAYFNKDMFLYDDELLDKDNLFIYQAWDLAISEEHIAHGNWTVGVTWGIDYDDNAHVLECVRMKTNDTAIIEDAIIDMYSRYKNVSGFGIEDGQISRTMKKSLKKRMQEKRVYINLDNKEYILKPIKSKTVRARPLQGRMSNKKVRFPRGQAWVDTMMTEMLRFPAGAQDDQVDAMAWVAILAVGKAPPGKPKPTFRKTEKTVSEKIRDFGRGVERSSHMAA